MASTKGHPPKIGKAMERLYVSLGKALGAGIADVTKRLQKPMFLHSSHPHSPRYDSHLESAVNTHIQAIAYQHLLTKNMGSKPPTFRAVVNTAESFKTKSPKMVAAIKETYNRKFHDQHKIPYDPEMSEHIRDRISTMRASLPKGHPFANKSMSAEDNTEYLDSSPAVIKLLQAGNYLDLAHGHAGKENDKGISDNLYRAHDSMEQFHEILKDVPSWHGQTEKEVFQYFVELFHRIMRPIEVI